MTRHVTIEIDAEMLTRAEAAGINLSALLTRALRRELPLVSDTEWQRAREEWYLENKQAVDAVNRMVDEDGFVFSDGARTF